MCVAAVCPARAVVAAPAGGGVVELGARPVTARSAAARSVESAAGDTLRLV